MSAWTCRQSDGKANPKIVPPRPRIPCWKGLGADSGEKHEPAGDIDTEAVDSLKAIDPNRPIREADVKALPIRHRKICGCNVRFPRGRHVRLVLDLDLIA
jgi:hypothetical protein